MSDKSVVLRLRTDEALMLEVAGKLEAEVKKRNEWYGLDNWPFEDVVNFVLEATADAWTGEQS